MGGLQGKGGRVEGLEGGEGVEAELRKQHHTKELHVWQNGYDKNGMWSETLARRASTEYDVADKANKQKYRVKKALW